MCLCTCWLTWPSHKPMSFFSRRLAYLNDVIGIMFKNHNDEPQILYGMTSPIKPADWLYIFVKYETMQSSFCPEYVCWAMYMFRYVLVSHNARPHTHTHIYTHVRGWHLFIINITYHETSTWDSCINLMWQFTVFECSYTNTSRPCITWETSTEVTLKAIYLTKISYAAIRENSY